MKNHITTTVSMRLIQEGVTWPFLQKMGTTVQNPGEEKMQELHHLMQQLMPENAVVWSMIETVETEYRDTRVRNGEMEQTAKEFFAEGKGQTTKNMKMEAK